MKRDWTYSALIWLFTVFTIGMVAVITFPAVVFAEMSGDVPPDLAGFWEAVGARHWPLAVGIGLTTLVWATRHFVLHKIPKNVIPWVTLGLAIAGTTGARMVQSISAGAVWWHGMVEGILEGATVGFAAIGWWDAKQTIKRRATKSEAG